ncbi:Gfo/Idh/MocA family oxidoreductase [Diaminobutyricibacter tongyongensis]|uniref:Gfo/Idh/MocA family oxidoreductase n=2 Tax=Leifsonia tongyongensis TaxID=1268043 RepID=A0A6L9XVG1_9MICO|nr:Gfo/Idh/MocA family oxidoreductase [Diaminobutyricibacter tongyongensis]
MVQIGAGGMGRAWLETLVRSADADIVGLVDLDLGSAREAAASIGRPDLPIARSLTDLAIDPGADAVLNVTVPAAHHAVTTQALLLGLAVLSEKPAAPTVAEALSLAATAEVTGQLLMVSQSRRYFRQLAAFRREVRNTGPVGLLSNQFFRAAHFGGFREEMAYPLLVDMAIHPFDVARYLLGCEPVAVYCDSFNPSWSWYAGDASAVALFEFEGDARFEYTGSWCSPGAETSWNGSWRASTAGATVLWDGEGAPVIEGTGAADIAADDAPEEIAGALAEFVTALRSGAVPWGEIHDNVGSLAMVEAAVRSASTRTRILIADVVELAYSQALAADERAAVHDQLRGWGSGSAGLDPAARLERLA